MKRRWIFFVGAMSLMLMLLSPLQVAAADEWSSEVLLHEFNGTILDFDESRIVWKEAGDKKLWLFNRADESEVKVYDAAGPNDKIHSAKLSAEGVVLTISNTDPSGWPTYHSVYYWKDGNVQNLIEGSYPYGDVYDVKGNFAVFNNRVLDLATGQSRSLPNSGFQNTNRFDLSADGTVVYTDPTYSSDLYKSLPDGTLTTHVLPNGYLSYGGPLTDGTNTIYRVLKRYSSGYKWLIRFRDADDNITTLALNPFYGHFFNSRSGYQINNGWIAYSEYNKANDNLVLYVRSPEGEIKPIAETPPQSWKQSWYYRSSLTINQLGADGSMVYTVYYGNLKYGKTFLYSAQSDTHLRVSGGPAEFRYLNGAWYRLAGNSLYAIQQ
ncbi:hypothetical protein [Paenibacillus arenilitoris]|uniref:DUF5050 domain-containing protein n=1 Tax=Paenibacillus arenilitoris TaxID=2772299 RepID=A0A927CGW9_9BACL|nr:hypothetical protein [Paenibacillus arenilitoris]MBD2867330.1 hypothetical protein [Paenibacillus arenilitoris]